MVNWTIAAAGVVGVAMAAHAWHAAGPRRIRTTIAALVAGAMMAVLAWRPTHEVAGRNRVTIGDDAALADVEAAAMRLAADAEVTVTGHGLDSASLGLLSSHRIAWRPSAAPTGVAALDWPHRAVLGERAAVRGAVAAHDSAWVFIEHPDGARDSVLTDSAFQFGIVPRAAGTWQWVVRHGAAADTVGVQVAPAPAPQIAWIEGRPSREASVLGALVGAQGGGMLQRTRLTASAVRVTRHGAAPEGNVLTPDLLRGLDAIVIGPGGLTVLGAGERSALRTAVDSGLGVVHLVDTVTTGAVMPFGVRAAPGDQRVRVAFDGGSAVAVAVPLAPVTLVGGEVFLRSITGVPLAWRMRIGRGVVVATRVTQPSRWGLAGEPAVEASWWSVLLGAAMRAPRAEWRVRNDALARVDHPLMVQRVGEAGDSALVLEGGAASMIALASGPDSTTKLARLWPRDTGWIALAQDGDTIRLHVAARDAHPSLDRAARRRATSAVEQRRPDPTSAPPVPPSRERLHLWWAWAALVLALATLWARRGP